MIHLKYDREKNSTLVYVDNLNLIGFDFVIIEFKNIITNEIHYTTKLRSNMWTSWNGAELITDVLIYCPKGNLIKEFKWDVTENGDDIEKILWYYLLNRKNQNIKSNGLVIGTHDGRNGHWIYPIKENLSTATLVDGSEKQFSELKKNYKNFNNVGFMNEIVTPEEQIVEWYQGGEGYTDTVVRDLIHDWLDETQIVKSERKSYSFKKLTKENDFDWLHLDVEGIDDELILSLEKLPNIIIFESMNLSDEKMNNLNSWFKQNNYQHITVNGNTLAMKN